MKKIKIGVIGCGSIAQHRHLPEYANNDQVEIVAVCDIVDSRAAQVAEKYGAKSYTEYSELLPKCRSGCGKRLYTELPACSNFCCCFEGWKACAV